jgi:hypothetical protein
MFNPQGNNRPDRNMVVRSPANFFSPEYQRSLQFYRERAAPVFSSYFAAPFWHESVLQLGSNDPLLQNGIMTASSLIESLSASSGNGQARFFQNYNTTIRRIRESSSVPPVEAMMVLIGLFASCEFCNGAFESGLTHVRAGFNIAQDFLEAKDKSGSSTHLFLTEQALPMLAGFAFQAKVYGFGLLSDSQLSAYSDAKYILPHVPKSFASVQQAHHCLSGIMHHLALIETSVGCAWDWQLFRTLGDLFGAWTDALDRYEQLVSHSQRQNELPALGMLRCNFQIALSLMEGLSRDVNAKPESTRTWTALFRQIPHNITVLGIGTALRQGAMPTEIECIPSLFIVALGTLNGTTCLSALDILEKWDRKEGNWTAVGAAKAARMIISEAHTSPQEVAQMQRAYLPLCLHVASIQFPLNRILQWLHPAPFAESVFARCACQKQQTLPPNRSLDVGSLPEVSSEGLAEAFQRDTKEAPDPPY